jgi:Haem-binding domain
VVLSLPADGADRNERARRRSGEWDEDDGEADDAADAVADGSMPPRRYVLVHPDAALSGAERQVLVDALEAMDRARGGGDRSGPGGGD